MEIWSCAFVGQKKFYYKPYREKILNKIDFVIQRGVTHFYNFYKNSFDTLCAAAVDKLRNEYLLIKNILVLPCKPEGEFVLPDCFDKAVYLQDNDVPTKFDLRKTYRKLVQSVDYVICGVTRAFGVARATYNFAKWALKSTYNVVTDKSKFWIEYSPEDVEKAYKEFEERMKTDEVYRALVEEAIRRCQEQAAPAMEKQAKKYKNKKHKAYKPPVWITAETIKKHR